MTKQEQFKIIRIFSEVDGVYYDAVGDEIFIVKKLSMNAFGKVYTIEFDDSTRVGNLEDNGHNHYLGPL